MPDGCIICDAPRVATSAHCPRCGFPPALTSVVVVGSLTEAETDGRTAGENGSAPPVGRPPGPEEFLREEEEASRGFARGVRRSLTLLGELGGDGTEVTSELRQAALLSAEGRLGEALNLLRTTQTTASVRLTELFEARLTELEERQRALVGQGLTPDLLQESVRLRAEIAEAPVEEVAAHLAEEDRRLARTEAEWQELRGVLRQIDQVRQGARALGREFPAIDAGLATVKELLAQPSISASGVSQALEEGNRVLGLYQANLAPGIQEELDLHAAHLARFAPDHEPSRKARRLHAEANRHLRASRLAEATLRLGELRTELRRAGGAAPGRPPSGAAEGGAAGGPGADEAALRPLLARVRTLAARIQELPPQSPLAGEAARRIRQATEQLRARKVEEAGRTLTELMELLGGAEAPAAE